LLKSPILDENWIDEPQKCLKDCVGAQFRLKAAPIARGLGMPAKTFFDFWGTIGGTQKSGQSEYTNQERNSVSPLAGRSNNLRSDNAKISGMSKAYCNCLDQTGGCL